jgi:hypothetical protein
MPGMRALLLLATLAACGARTPRPYVWSDRLRSVHVDHVEPSRLAGFIAARQTWLAAVARAGAADWRGLFLQLDGATFLTVAPAAGLGDLEARRQEHTAALAGVDPDAAHVYDLVSDQAVVPPHMSEIWVRQPLLDYTPADGPESEVAAVCGRIVYYDLRDCSASQSSAAEAAWKQLLERLAATGYPLAARGFYSQYGSGRVVVLWLGRTTAACATPPPDEDTDACTAGREIHEVVVRHDLSGYGPTTRR